jgi:uncharacterized protein with ATP-grasp and redox domains
MHTYLDCYPCVLRQAVEAAHMAGASPVQARHIVLETLDILKALPEYATPPEIAAQVQKLVRELTGVNDPYLQVKQESTAKALGMLPELRKIISASKDSFETAIRISIAGNIIDFGPKLDFNLWDVVDQVLTTDIAINDLPILRSRLAEAQSVLILGDNAGEHVFDKLLVEALELPVAYAVRGGPVLNDVTMEDAAAIGLDKLAEVIDSGARIPGTVLPMCSQSFRERFNSADLILSKGMGNYESLSEVQAPIFFLLRVKCPVICADIHAPLDSIVIKHSGV